MIVFYVVELLQSCQSPHTHAQRLGNRWSCMRLFLTVGP
jgi:hypothetical protein